MKKHINIPVFIPHLGCPNQCVFCNQHKITGVSDFSLEEVKRIIDNALLTVGDETEAEIAFFGGSFTGIDYDLMCKLLEIANSYVIRGKVSSIRCSTRPDYINTKILETLKAFNVKVIELGLQSSVDAVLHASKRGHNSTDEYNACKLIKAFGFELVGQMMIGLPGADTESELATARFIVDSGASAARIYPTVVFRDTELCDMVSSGIYKPLSLEEAIERSATVLSVFREAGVDVIRIGLCASENLSSPDSYFAGPNHPALGELVENEYYYKIISEKLRKMKLIADQKIIITVPSGSLSKAIGQNKRNKLRLMSEFGIYPSFRESDEVDVKHVEVICEERI